MTDISHSIVNIVSAMLELFGIGAIALGSLFSTLAALRRMLGKAGGRKIFVEYRRRLGQGILLGLEFLVAADIIRTVAVEPTFRKIGVLAGIVLIRTFLSFTLEAEMTGRWPWQGGSEEAEEDRG